MQGSVCFFVCLFNSFLWCVLLGVDCGYRLDIWFLQNVKAVSLFLISLSLLPLSNIK